MLLAVRTRPHLSPRTRWRVLLLISLCLAAACLAGRLLQAGPGSPAETPGGQSQSTAVEAAERAVAACLAQDGSPPPTTYADFLESRPAHLQPEVVLFSRRPRTANATIVVTFTMERLYMLEGMCDSWGGPIAAAVYQGYLPDAAYAVGEARLHARALHARLEAAGGCQADLLLFSEAVADEQVATLFPVNSLRNRALVAAATPLLFLLDGDMVASASLRAEVADAAAMRRLLGLTRRRTYVVIPGFEVADKFKDNYFKKDGLVAAQKEFALQASQRAKGALLDLVRSEWLQPFNARTFSGGHGRTNFTRWMAEDEFYPIDYQYPYEPWGLFDRRLAPWFDYRFRGYGKNKVVFLATLKYLGFSFMAHPHSFVVHRAHKGSKVKRMYVYEKKGYSTEGNFWKFIDDLISQIGNQMENGTYTALGDPAAVRCRQQLGWWQ